MGSWLPPGDLGLGDSARHSLLTHLMRKEKESQVRVTVAPTKPWNCPALIPIDVEKDRKSAGLVSSSLSLKNTEAGQSFRFPCGSAPTHSKPGKAKVPEQCLLASSWCFLFWDISTVKYFTKPWGVNVISPCRNVLAPAVNQLTQLPHFVRGRPTLPPQPIQIGLERSGVKVGNRKVIILGLDRHFKKHCKEGRLWFGICGGF